MAADGKREIEDRGERGDCDPGTGQVPTPVNREVAKNTKVHEELLVHEMLASCGFVIFVVSSLKPAADAVVPRDSPGGRRRCCGTRARPTEWRPDRIPPPRGIPRRPPASRRPRCPRRRRLPARGRRTNRC